MMIAGGLMAAGPAAPMRAGSPQAASLPPGPIALSARAGHAPRILSLNPCTDALLGEVADTPQVLGISAYSRDPGQSSMDRALARRLPVTGGTLEEVIAAHPDIVVTGGIVSPAMRAAYARMGVRLEVFGVPGTVEQSEAQVRRMAALAGHGARGQALVARIEAALAGAAPPRGARPIPALVWQGGGIVPGRQALISDLLERTGFVSYSAARGMRQADVLPLEELVANPPRVILVAGANAGGPGEDRLLSHPVLERLRGVRRFAFPPALEWCGGPTIIRAAERLRAVRQVVEQEGGA